MKKKLLIVIVLAAAAVLIFFTIKISIDVYQQFNGPPQIRDEIKQSFEKFLAENSGNKAELVKLGYSAFIKVTYPDERELFNAKCKYNDVEFNLYYKDGVILNDYYKHAWKKEIEQKICSETGLGSVEAVVESVIVPDAMQTQYNTTLNIPSYFAENALCCADSQFSPKIALVSSDEYQNSSLRPKMYDVFCSIEKMLSSYSITFTFSDTKIQIPYYEKVNIRNLQDIEKMKVQ